MKKCIGIILILFFIISFFNVPGSKAETKFIPDNFSLICKEGNSKLFADEKTGAFVYEKDNKKYRSFPSELKETMKPITKNRLTSAAVFKTVTSKTNKETTYYSNNLARTGGITFSKTEKGYTLKINAMSKVKFDIDVTLSDEKLLIRVPVKSLEETGGEFLKEISLFQGFISFYKSKDGNLIVPDGNGSLFPGGSKIIYNEPIYGYDKAVLREVQALRKADIYLPIYGKNGIIGRINEGEGNGFINANTVCSNDLPFNIIYPNFVLRNFEEIGITDDSKVKIYDNKNVFNSDIEIEFCTSEDGDYVSLIDKLKSGNISEKSAPLNLNFILGEKVKAKFLGIPLWDKVKKITTFNEVKDVLEDILKETKNISISLYDFEENEILGKLSEKVKIPGTLGGEKQLKELASFCKKNNIKIYAFSNASKFIKSGGGTTILKNGIRQISKEITLNYEYNLASYEFEPETEYYYADIKRVAKVFKERKKKFEVLGLTFSVSDISNVTYSNFAEKKETSKNSSNKEFEKLLKNVPSNYSYYFANGDAIKAPTTSSLIKESINVPLYQILFSGERNFGGAVLNEVDNPSDAILFSMETGSSLNFNIIKRELENENIEYQGALYKKNEKYLKNIIAKYIKDIEKINGEKIISYKIISEYERETIFENGIKVVTDYSKGTYEIY